MDLKTDSRRHRGQLVRSRQEVGFEALAYD